MSNLQPNCCLEFDFRKVDQHAGGKWLIHDTKRRKDNQLQSLKPPAEYPSWVARCDIKGSVGTDTNDSPWATLRQWPGTETVLLDKARFIYEMEIVCKVPNQKRLETITALFHGYYGIILMCFHWSVISVKLPKSLIQPFGLSDLSSFMVKLHHTS